MMKLQLSFIPKGSLVLLAAMAWPLLGGRLLAQDTNAPKTILETFEAQTGVILVQGTMLIGSVSADAGMVSVGCKETKDAGTGRKESGLAIQVREGEARTDTTIVDYDEVDSLLNAIDYLSRADYRVTTLPAFDVVYMTKAGLRIATYSSSRSPGTIKVAVQSSQINRTRVVLAPQQFAQFQSLIQQAKGKLDALRTGK